MTRHGASLKRDVDSPRHRYACRPSLQLRWKEGCGKLFFYPLSAGGEERVVQRSVDRVSRFWNQMSYYPKQGACHPELVEGACAEACPPCFDGAQHDILFN